MPLRDEAANRNIEPCVACGNPSECAVWGHRTCYPCVDDWRDHAPTWGELVEKYGPKMNSAEKNQEFTLRWIERRRKEQAA